VPIFDLIRSGILQTSAWSLAQLIVGRLISGVGLGFQVATVPTWQSECSKPKTQGRWVMFEGGILIVGLACGQLLGYGFFFAKGQVQWRAPVGIQILPATVVFSLIMFLPESPRWLIKHGMFDEGNYNLRMLRDWDEDDPRLVQERESIVASFEAQKGDAPFQYRELFSGGKTQTFRRMMLGVFMQAAQQLTGINMVSTYANQILGTTFNFSPETAHLIAALTGVEYAVCALLAVFFIEGLGRRKTFMLTSGGMCICFIVISILLSRGGRTNELIATGFLFVFNSIFGFAWVGGPYLYSAEIAPLRSRAQCNAVANGSNWLFTFLIVMTIPVSFATIGWKTYIYYAIFNACFIPVLYFFMVETKGRSLEELDVIFAAPGDPVKNEMRMPHDISSADARRILGLDVDADADADVGEDKGSSMEKEKKDGSSQHVEAAV
jgi:sugar porter (SP) family MFS transporter